MRKKATIDAKAFSEGLDQVSKALQKSMYSALSEVSVRVEDGVCILTATDLDTWLIKRLPAQGDDLAFVFTSTRDVAKACRMFDGVLELGLEETCSEQHKEWSILPIIVVVVTVNFIKLPVYYCMALGVVVALVFGWKNIPDILDTLNTGVESAVFALVNTCAANGFGGVAQATQGFADLVEVLTTTSFLPPLLSVGIATTLIAGACGSGTGGLSIAVSTLGPIYIDMGVDPGLIHRMACVSCCGLDSLPHNGAVVTLLKYTGISHADGYIHIGVTTVIVPLLTLVLMFILGSVGLTF